MHRHQQGHLDGESIEAQRAGPDRPDERLVKAAAARRTEVLGSSAVLGLQRTAGNAATVEALDEDRASVHDVISSGGQPLEEGVRTDLEDRMGQDFSDVRVHTDDAADKSARSVSAHAYTTGSNIVFQRGAYDPGSTAGKTMLAHELTHVVQQRSGPVDGSPVGGGISVSDPSDRFEREASANAEAVMSRPAPVQRRTEGSTGFHAPVVQRQEEEEELQASHDDSLGPVQRQEEEEEDEQA